MLKIDVIQPPFSIVNQSERELMEWAETQGIGTMTYGSLGGGIFNRSYSRNFQNQIQRTCVRYSIISLKNRYSLMLWNY